MSEPLPADPREMAEPWHLSAELFRRFLEERASQSERRAVIRHLIAQCPECLGLVGRIVADEWARRPGVAADLPGSVILLETAVEAGSLQVLAHRPGLGGVAGARNPTSKGQ